MLEKKLLEEINRYREINRYARRLMNEQELPPPPGDELPPPPGGDLPPEGGLPPGDVDPTVGPESDMPPTDTPQDMDTMTSPEDPMGDTEEIDITDLVNMTKSIKKELDSKKSDTTNVDSKMNDVFTKLDDLEKKLSSMDNIISKIEDLGSKVENMRPKSPQEKLNMRSLDSYPFNQNPQQFFAQKQDEMQLSGKNEYVLTKDDVINYSKENIKNTFNSNLENEEYKY